MINKIQCGGGWGLFFPPGPPPPPPQAHQDVPEFLEQAAEEAIGSDYGPAGGRFASKDLRVSGREANDRLLCVIEGHTHCCVGGILG